jgi:hypothetical protein
MSERPQRKTLTLNRDPKKPVSGEKAEEVKEPVEIQSEPEPEVQPEPSLEKSADETRSEYYRRVKAKLAAEVAALESAARKDPSLESKLLTKIDELHEAENRINGGVSANVAAIKQRSTKQMREAEAIRAEEERAGSSDRMDHALLTNEMEAETYERHTGKLKGVFGAIDAVHGDEEDVEDKEAAPTTAPEADEAVVETSAKKEEEEPAEAVEANAEDPTSGKKPKGKKGGVESAGNKSANDNDDETVMPGSTERLPVRVADEHGIEDGIFYDLGEGSTEPHLHGRIKPEFTTPEDAAAWEKGELERRAAMLAEKSGLSEARSAMLSSHKAYLDAVHKFQKERSGLGIASEKFTGAQMPKELKEMRRAWVANRQAFYTQQLESVDTRLKDRVATPEKVLEGLKNYKGKGHFTPEEIKARYESMISVRSTVLGFEEAEKDARVEGLSERDKGRFEKAMDWYNKKPAWVRIGVTSAIMFGGAAYLASGVGIGATLIAGTSIAARIHADMNKGTLLGGASTAFAKVIAVGAMIGFAAEGTVRGYHLMAGTERKAKELVNKQKGFGDLSKEGAFEKLSKERSKALVAKENIQRQGRLARMVASLTGGFIYGHTMGHSTPEAGGGSTDTSGLDTNHGATGSFEHHQSSTTHEQHTDSQAPIKEESLSIHGKVFDADRLTGHFRDQLTKEYGDDLSKAPPAVRTFIEHHGTQDELTKWLGLQSKDGTSAMMHEGDKIEIDSHGELVFVPKVGEAHTLIDAQGNMHKFDLSKFHTTPNPHAVHAGPEQAPHTAPSAHTEQAVTHDAEAAPVSTSDTTEHSLDDTMNSVAPNADAAAPAPEVHPTGPSSTDGLGDMNDLSNTPTTASSPEVLSTASGAAALATEAHTSATSNTPGLGDLNDLDNARPTGSSPEVPHTVFPNIHNVPVDLTSAHEYVWRVPGSSKDVLVTYGGSEEDMSSLAKEYVLSHPKSTMAFMHIEKNALGFETGRHLSGWKMGSNGQPEFIENATRALGTKNKTPDANDFTSLIA